jgi:small subunit ribosomal protein S17
VAKQASSPAQSDQPAKSGRPASRKRELVGVVTGDKMNKTRVVTVERRLSHAKYGKYMTKRAKYKAHDEKNQYRVGDRVVIVESRPLSRQKRWRVERLLERAQEV